MNEKVLGFKEPKKISRTGWINFHYSDRVPIRLASESVDLKALKKWCEGKQTWRNDYVNVSEMLSWAEKEAKKQAGEKK